MELIKNIILITLIFSTLGAKELEKVSLQLQWLDQFQFAGYYMAKEKGYYRDVGLDVELKKYHYGILGVDEVINQKATYAIGRSSLIASKAKGADIRLLSAIFQSSPSIMIARKDSNITTIKDFRGKKIMSTPDALEMVSIYAMTNRYGISKANTITLQHSFDITDIINKKADLMLAYISNEPFLLQKQGVEYTIFDPKDYGFDFYSDILFTSTQEINRHRQRTINFTNASLKGWEYAFSHIDETVNLILKKYNPQHKSKEALLYEAVELKKLAYYKNIKLGHIDTHKIQRIYDIYNVMGLVHKKIDMQEFVFSPQNSTIHLNEAEKSYLKTKKVLRLCIDPNWMPFEALENAKYIGISADYFKLFQEKLKIPIHLIPTTSWSQTLEFAQNRKCDIVSLITKTQQRETYLNFTTPLITSPLALATKLNTTFTVDFEDLSNKKLAMPKNYANAEILKRKYPHLTIIEVKSIKEGLTQVRDAKVYGLIGSLEALGYLIQKDFTGELKIGGKFNENITAPIGLRNDHKELLGIFQKLIDSISPEQHRHIINTWTSIELEVKKDYTLLWQLLSGFIFTVVMGLLFFIKQNQLNKNLEQKIKDEVSKNRQKEKQMLHQSRLAQMGEMISMIAHQWRQPLGAISTTAVNLKLKLELEAFDLETKEGVQEANTYFLKRLSNIEDYVGSLTTTIDDFRNFYKPNKESIHVTFESVATKALDIIGASLANDNVELIYEYHSQEMIEMYNSEMMQVILNILKNAQDNFKEKTIKYPHITIRTSEKSISISDNGGGISKNLIEKIFDPYFSTKDEKNGTGLGLYMSKIIVEDHHKGSLHVSNSDDGACFNIELGKRS